jgi:cytochrome c-type biogenesis protein CcmH/NrfG
MAQPESRTARLERCRQAVEQSPGSAAAHDKHGLALPKIGRLQEAEQANHKAGEIEPTLAEAWVSLGGVRLHSWDFEGCLADPGRSELRTTWCWPTTTWARRTST